MSGIEDKYREIYKKCATISLISTEEELEFYKANAKSDEEIATYNKQIEIIEEILKDRENGV